MLSIIVAKAKNNIIGKDNKMLWKLPDDLKQIIRLFYYEDMKQKTIAEKLNMNEMMVSRKLKKAYSLMYNLIKDSETLD